MAVLFPFANVGRISPIITHCADYVELFMRTYIARRYDLARERAHELLEVAPNYVWAHFFWMAQIYEQQGQQTQKRLRSSKRRPPNLEREATGGVRLKITESLQNQTTCHECWWQKRVCGFVISNARLNG